MEAELLQIVGDLARKELNEGSSPTKAHQAAIKLKHFNPPASPSINLLKNANITTYDTLCSEILKANELTTKNLS